MLATERLLGAAGGESGLDDGEVEEYAGYSAAFARLHNAHRQGGGVGRQWHTAVAWLGAFHTCITHRLCGCADGWVSVRGGDGRALFS